MVEDASDKWERLGSKVRPQNLPWAVASMTGAHSALRTAITAGAQWTDITWRVEGVADNARGYAVLCRAFPARTDPPGTCDLWGRAG